MDRIRLYRFHDKETDKPLGWSFAVCPEHLKETKIPDHAVLKEVQLGIVISKCYECQRIHQFK